MLPEVQATLDFMLANEATVLSADNESFAEWQILKIISGNTPSTSDVLCDAYLLSMQRGVPNVQTRADAYRLTHNIFFATDFGRHAIIGVDIPGHSTLIENLVPQYLADTDVLGELLMAAKCIGYWSVNLENAKSTFISSWSALDRNNFVDNYHPILIGGILLAMG